MKKILAVTLALVVFAGAAQAQDSTRHHRKPGGHDMMAKQLNLTADQQAKLKSIREAQHKDMQALKENKSLSPEQLKNQRSELSKQYRSQFESVLTPAQKEQMEKQKAEWKNKAHKKGSKKEGTARHGKDGKGFKNGDAFQKELNLTQDQKDRMAKLRTESKTQFQSIRNDQTLSEEQKKEKLKSFQKQQQEQMKAILTPEQIEKMKSFRKERPAKATK